MYFPIIKNLKNKRQVSDLRGRLPNENVNHFKVRQSFCFLEQKFQKAFKTYKTCCFENFGVYQIPIPSLPCLQFSEFAPIKHIPTQFHKNFWSNTLHGTKIFATHRDEHLFPGNLLRSLSLTGG